MTPHLDTELLRRLQGAKIINPHRLITEYYVTERETSPADKEESTP
jgi:hypothetical protein